jgi:hypothetical protein
MSREKAEPKPHRAAEKQVPKIIKAKDLSELEIKLLLLLEKTINGPSAVYSLNELAELTEATTSDLMSAVTALSSKGYLRYRKLVTKEPGSFEASSLKDTVEKALTDIFDNLNKIERLSGMQDQTPKPAYKKVLEELSKGLVQAARRLSEVERARVSQLRQIQDTIESDGHKLAEVRLRMEIDHIDASEGAKLVEQYETEIRELKMQSASVGRIGVLSGQDQSVARQQELRRKISDLSEMLETARVRHLVGETTDEQFEQQNAILEHQKQEAIIELQRLENQPRIGLEELVRKTRGLGDAKVLPDKVTASVLSALEDLSVPNGRQEKTRNEAPQGSSPLSSS